MAASATLARQRSHVIERRRKRNHAAARHPPVGRLQPHASAQRSRFANRSGRVGPDRGVRHSRRNCGRRTSGRSSGNPALIPRIVHIAEVADQRTSAVSELMQIVLSDDHRPGVAQSSNNLRILRREFAARASALADVVRTPAVSIRSFSATGIPCSGPRHSPRPISSSAVAPPRCADSAMTVMKALSAGLSFSIRPRQLAGNLQPEKSPSAASAAIDQKLSWKHS